MNNEKPKRLPYSQVELLALIAYKHEEISIGKLREITGIKTREDALDAIKRKCGDLNPLAAQLDEALNQLATARKSLSRAKEALRVISKNRNGIIPVHHLKEFIALPIMKKNQPADIEYEVIDTPSWAFAENELKNITEAKDLVEDSIKGVRG